MPVLVRAEIDGWTGYARLRFPFDRATIERIKDVPGARWDPNNKCWWISRHGLEALKGLGLKVSETEIAATIPNTQLLGASAIPEQIAQRLRDYQIAAASFLLNNAGALLTMEMRTGKTPATIGAITAAMGSGVAQAAFIAYPASVRETWRAELKKWAGLELLALESYTALTDVEIAAARSTPWLVLGCHYEILSQREEDVHKILAGRSYVAVSDELHHCKNRKATRTKALRRIGSAWGQVKISNAGYGEDDSAAFDVNGGYCLARWGLTGTPMRNRNKDLFCLFDWITPGSVGGYWAFAKRYSDAHINERGHWEDKGNSNDAELNQRLFAVSYRVTRAQVASYLPKSDRKVIMCAMPLPLMRKYRALEKAYATGVVAAMDESAGGSEDSLKQLALATIGAKIPTAVDRAYDHASRGVKVICAANYHETLQQLDESFDAYVDAEKAVQSDGVSLLPPHFCAGGWKTPTKRHEIIEQWRACPGPAILLVNTISSGVGIDLADAEALISVELTWVPADYRQLEDRIQDVHKGKRLTPPLYEMLVVKDTIDEAMAAKLLEKIKNIESVVGADAESADVAGVLRGAGVVGNDRLGLPNTSHETVMAAIASIRDRWLSDEPEDEQTEGEKIRDRLLAAASSLDDDDEPSSIEEGAGVA